MAQDLSVTLFTLLGTQPNTIALRRGECRSPLIKFEFADVKVSNTQFKPLVRDAKYDLGELAIVTFLQAYNFQTPYILLPATVMGRSQHHTIFYNAKHGRMSPYALNGRRIGVRAYPQTTGTWVRGFLADDYGVDPFSIKWITFETPHVASYRAPSCVERAPEGKSLKGMLLSGEIDAAILGDVPEEGPLRHLIPDHEAVARLWAEKHGGIPITRLMVIRESIAQMRPDVVREVYGLLRTCADAATSTEPGRFTPLRFGVENIRKSLDQIIDYSVRQKLIPRRLTVDELFEKSSKILN